MKSLLLTLLVAGVLFSAVEVIMSQHTARKYFVDIQQLKQQQYRLNEEWGKLQLEQSTWATDDRVEQIARSRLEMTEPDPDSIVLILR